MSRMTLTLALLALALSILSASAADVASLVNDLRNKDDEICLAAVDELSTKGGEAVAPLVRLIAGRDDQLALWGRIALEKLVKTVTAPGAQGRAEVATALMDSLADQRSHVTRNHILRLVALCGGPEVVPALAERLGHPQDGEMARYALDGIPDAAAIGALCEAYKGAKPAMRAAILNALGHRRNAEALPTVTAALKDADARARLAAIGALGRIPAAESEPVLRSLATRGSAAVREQALTAYANLAEALLRSGNAEAAEPLYVWLYARRETHLKCAGLIGYAKIAQRDAVPTLLAAVKAGSPEVRGAAKIELSLIDGSDVTREIANAIGGERAEVRIALIEALELRRDPAAVPALAEALRSPNESVQLAALQALGAIQSPDCAEDVIVALRRGSESVRAEAEATLRKIPGEKAADVIIFGSKFGSDAVRAALMRALYARTEPGVIATLSDALTDDDEDVAKAAADTLGAMRDPAALGAMVTSLDGAPDEARAAILRVLGNSRDASLLPLLTKAANDANEDVAVAAIEGLGKLADRRAVPTVRELSKTQTGKVKGAAVSAFITIAGALVQGSPSAALPMLHEALELAPGPGETRAALQQIGRVGDPRSLSIVEPLLDHANADVREAAATAVVPMATRLAERGDTERAVDLLLIASERSKSREALTAAGRALRERGIHLDIAARQGFITQWCVIGPVGTRDELREADILETGGPIDISQAVKYGDQTHQWRYAPIDDPAGLLDFEKAAARQDDTGAYAYAEVTAPEAMDAQLKLGSDDDIVCWLNGEKVLEKLQNRGWAPDQDSVDVRLREGCNTILIKVLNGGAQWAGSVRVTERGGTPLQLPQWDPIADLAAKSGFVTRYIILGPLPGRDPWLEKDALPTDAPVDPGKPVKVGDETFTWRPRLVHDAAGGQLDLDAALGQLNNVGAYAYTELSSDRAQDILLKVGSDDDVYVWLNGEAVHRNNTPRPCKADEDVVEARLKAGANTLLVKVLNGAADWALAVRITDRDGNPLVLEQGVQ